MSDLFLPDIAGGLLCAPGVREVSGRVLGTLLSKRFDFHGAEMQGVFEALEAYLVVLAGRLEQQEFMVTKRSLQNSPRPRKSLKPASSRLMR